MFNVDTKEERKYPSLEVLICAGELETRGGTRRPRTLRLSGRRVRGDHVLPGEEGRTEESREPCEV